MEIIQEQLKYKFGIHCTVVVSFNVTSYSFLIVFSVLTDFIKWLSIFRWLDRYRPQIQLWKVSSLQHLTLTLFKGIHILTENNLIYGLIFLRLRMYFHKLEKLKTKAIWWVKTPSSFLWFCDYYMNKLKLFCQIREQFLTPMTRTAEQGGLQGL